MEKNVTSIRNKVKPEATKNRQELKTLQRLLNASLDVICSIDNEGRFIYVSPAARQVWGYEPEELTGKLYMDFVLPEDKAKTIAIAEAIMSGVNVTSFENRYKRKEGSVIPVVWSAHWCAEELVMYCVAKDATQLKADEKQQKLQQNKLQRAYTLAGLAWWDYDVASQTYTSSDEIFSMYGLPVPENNQTTLAEFLSYVHPYDVARLKKDLSTISSDVYSNYEHRIVKPSGEVIHVIHYSEVTRDSEGNALTIHGTTKDITEEKKKEEKLQLINERFNLASKVTSDVLWDWDTQSGTLYFNNSFTRLFGYNVIAGNIHDAWINNIHEDDKENTLSSLHNSIECQTSHKWEAEYRFYRQDGSIAFVLDRGYIIRNNEGKAIRMVGSMQDITKLKEEECIVAKSERKFKAMVQSGKDMIMLLTASFEVFYTSPNYSEITGYDFDEVSGFLCHDNVHPDDYEKLLEVAEDIFTRKTVSLPLFRSRSKSGEYRWYEATLSNQLENQDLKAIISNIRDVTERVAAEEEMKILSLVAKETENVVIITDAEQKITWVNRAFTDKTEYTFDEAIGKNPGQMLQGPNTNKGIRNYIRKRIEQKRPFNCEIINYTKSGRAYWMEIKGQPIFDGQGQLKQFFAIQTDVTKRKEAEAIISVSEEKYKLLFYNSPRPKWIIDAETMQITDVNNAAVELYSYSKEEFIGLKIQDLKRTGIDAELAAVEQTGKTKNGTQFNSLERHRKKDGTEFYIDITSFAIQLPSGLHFISTGADMTEKLQLQKRLIAEKIAAQKEISRAIIHAQETERSEIGKELHDNVCQLLTTSKLYIENIKYFPEQQEQYTKKGVELLLKSINEIRYLSKQLVSPELNTIGFDETIKDLIDHYRSLNLFEICFAYKANVELMDKDLKTSIIRILQEQFNNTVKYAKASQVQVCISNTDDTMKVFYRDNGIGFDPQQAKKGIGLSNIKSRTTAFNGKVLLTSASGKGYTMEITFPLTEQREFLKPKY